MEAIILDGAAADEAERALKLNLSRHRLSAARSRLENLRSRLRSCSGGVVEGMQQFLIEKLGNPRVRVSEVIDCWSTLVGELQDRVVISYNDEPTRQRTVIISPTQNDPGNGILSASHPLAMALLGRSIDDEIEVEAGDGTRTLIVQAIEKAGGFEDEFGGQRNDNG